MACSGQRNASRYARDSLSKPTPQSNFFFDILQESHVTAVVSVTWRMR